MGQTFFGYPVPRIKLRYSSTFEELKENHAKVLMKHCLTKTKDKTKFIKIQNLGIF